MDLNVSFKNDVTLLIGINGSGKTSVLNIIDWLLNPNVKKLAVTTFENITLSFLDKGTHYFICAEKTFQLMKLSLLHETENFPSIKVSLTHINFQNDETLYDDEIEEMYENVYPEEHEVPTWEKIRSFKNPIALSLDRNISNNSNDFVYYDKIIKKPTFGKKSPLNRVKEITALKYAEYREKTIDNDNKLKEEIVISMLQDPIHIFKNPFQSKFEFPTHQQISKLENRVNNYLSNAIKNRKAELAVKEFFKSSKQLNEKLQNKNANNDTLYFVLSQYQHLDGIIKAFDNFEKENDIAFQSIKTYLDVANRFFNDSGKTLYFDESRGNLFFKLNTNKWDMSDKKNERKSIDHFSSGEKQILILLTFLAFSVKKDEIFIVDEPELSLHPKWQSEFMDAFIELCPKETQIIMATHSPDIVGKHKEKCVSIRGNNARR